MERMKEASEVERQKLLELVQTLEFKLNAIEQVTATVFFIIIVKFPLLKLSSSFVFFFFFSYLIIGMLFCNLIL